MKTLNKEDIDLLERIRSYLPQYGTGMTNAVYITPPQQLRNSADRMEALERDEKLFKELIKWLKN